MSLWKLSALDITENIFFLFTDSTISANKKGFDLHYTIFQVDETLPQKCYTKLAQILFDILKLLINAHSYFAVILKIVSVKAFYNLFVQKIYNVLQLK
jgi:hypothetical protein